MHLQLEGPSVDVTGCVKLMVMLLKKPSCLAGARKKTVMCRTIFHRFASQTDGYCSTQPMQTTGTIRGRWRVFGTPMPTWLVTASGPVSLVFWQNASEPQNSFPYEASTSGTWKRCELQRARAHMNQLRHSTKCIQFLRRILFERVGTRVQATRRSLCS